MPKKTLGFCGTICALLCATPAAAATCEPGYYLVDGACQYCNPNAEPVYCPGDDTRHNCPTTGTDYSQFGYILLNSAEATWASMPVASSLYSCRSTMFFRDGYGNEFLKEDHFNGVNYWQDNHDSLFWYLAGTGWYLASYQGTTYKDWYYTVKSCTNAPAHAHYTGPGTPDDPRSGGATDYNDCPWACDDEYGRVGNTCEPLCTTGVTHLRAGDVSAPLFPTRRTTPALVVQTAGGVCYGNLTSGGGAGINIRVDGTTYRVQ